MNKQKRSRGWTLVEILIVIAIVGLLLGFAIPAMNTAISSARKTQTDTTLRLLNTISSQTRQAGMTNAGNSGSDKIAALQYYKSQNWLRTEKDPDISNLLFEDGVWRAMP